MLSLGRDNASSPFLLAIDLDQRERERALPIEQGLTYLR